MKRNINGFTLFELLVSISIIAILTAVASVSFSGAQQKGRDAKRVQDMKALQNAAEVFYSLNSYSYPTTSGAGVSWTAGTQTVLSMFPTDPKGVSYPNQYYCVRPVSGAVLTGIDYCCCADVESNTSGNSDANCNNIGSTSGNFFCVRNQQ